MVFTARQKFAGGLVPKRHAAFTARISAAQSVLHASDARTERKPFRHARAVALLLCCSWLEHSVVFRSRTTAARLVGRADRFHDRAADWHCAESHSVHAVQLSAVCHNRPVAHDAHSAVRLSFIAEH